VGPDRRSYQRVCCMCYIQYIS